MYTAFRRLGRVSAQSGVRHAAVKMRPGCPSRCSAGDKLPKLDVRSETLGLRLGIVPKVVKRLEQSARDRFRSETFRIADGLNCEVWLIVIKRCFGRLADDADQGAPQGRRTGKGRRHSDEQ